MFGHTSTMLQTLFLASVFCQINFRGSRRKLQRGNSSAGILQRGIISARLGVGFEVGSGTNHRLYPFMARMVMDGAHKCGGSVISERIIATSRHCLKDCPCFPKQDWHLCPNICFIKLRENSDSQADTETIHTIEAVHLPENSGAPDNFEDYFIWDVTDFALVQLTRSVNDCEETSYSRDCWPISPVHLVGPETIIRKGDPARTIGWGATFSKESSEFMQQLNLKINSNSNFEYIMETDITPDGGDPCSGDSGGPLLIRNNKTYEWMLVATLLGGGHNCVIYDRDNPEQDKTGDWNKITPHLNWIERVVSSTSPPTDSPISTLTPAITGCASTWKQFGSHCYKFFGDKQFWNDAQSRCEKEGSNLASVHSLEENQFLINLTPEKVWIGANDKAKEGTWVWTDGSAWKLGNWRPGEPNNAHDGNEHCVEMKAEILNGKWNDVQCAGPDSYPFICKK